MLDHFVRGQLFGYIKANPGDHFTAILAALELNNGTGTYHLEVLEREGLVKSVQEGMYRRFYPTGYKVPDEPRLTRIQMRIYDMIEQNHGIPQKEIAQAIEASQQLVGYHLGILERNRLIRSERLGRWKRYYPTHLEERLKA